MSLSKSTNIVKNARKANNDKSNHLKASLATANMAQLLDTESELDETEMHELIKAYLIFIKFFVLVFINQN